MESHGFLISALVFLSAAVVCVPFCKKFGFGSILGYLLAGLIIGPWGLQLITNVEDIMHFSEFGVVLLLFLIGLELEPRKLWSMRLPIFGMGGMQVVLNTLAIAGLAKAFGQSTSVALLAGMGFALSSTAIALQILNEKKLLGSTSGNSAFSILLFQDMAVIPMIAVLPLLGSQVSPAPSENAWMSFAKAVVVLAVVAVLGRWIVQRALRAIAGLHLREIFTSFALLLVIAMAALMQSLHISMALGAFLAGVLLADSEYRHALETDIEPFKGLLMGLFFISVGMSVDIGSIIAHPWLVFGIGFLVMFTKYVIHCVIGKIFYIPRNQIPFFAMVLSQVGEFAFILFGAAKGFGILDERTTGILVAITAVSMLLTPLLVMLYDLIEKRMQKNKPKPQQDTIANERNPVIIAGFGRFGQIVGRLLYANKITATVLDYEPEQIEMLRRFGFKVYYGDATRLDLLESAGAREAKVLVVAIDNVEASLRLVDLARENFPHLKIFVRARNVDHMYELIERKITKIERETFESSLKMGGSVLHYLGLSVPQAETAMRKFREHNIKIIYEMQPHRKDQTALVSRAQQARDDLFKMFEEEAQILHGTKPADPSGPQETLR
jgi:glutathione-regulated potassium-efflux system ancillary protein KefC